ncbi:MAG: hypothetical protein ACRDPY_08535 [Streptosporangiaceae bacterium]
MSAPEAVPVADANWARSILASLPKSERQRLEVLQRVAGSAARSGNAAAAWEIAQACLAEAARALEQAQAEHEQLRTERSAARQEIAEARAMQARLERLEAELRSRPVPPDIGADLRPDPREARTPAEFMEALRRFRQWSGNPPFRRMWRRADQRAAVSTMCTVLRSNTLPDRLHVIDAIVEGCGGTDEDRRRFATAWRELTLARHPSRVVRPIRTADRAAV